MFSFLHRHNPVERTGDVFHAIHEFIGDRVTGVGVSHSANATTHEIRLTFDSGRVLIVTAEHFEGNTAPHLGFELQLR